jgi:uncharacterized protein involved in exopolysaccharide biosynthesis
MLAVTPVKTGRTSENRPTLYEHWFGNSEQPEALKKDRAVRRLRSAIKIHSSLESNLVHIETTAETPRLARHLNQRLLDLAESYYKEVRSEDLTAQKEFLEVTAARMRSSLRQAENELAAFLDSNANYQQSPALVQEYGRLLRNIELQQKVYLEIEAQLLSVGLELSGQSTSIRFLDSPTTPLEPSHPDPAKLILIAMFAMLGLNLLLVFSLNTLASRAETDRVAR